MTDCEVLSIEIGADEYAVEEVVVSKLIRVRDFGGSSKAGDDARPGAGISFTGEVLSAVLVVGVCSASIDVCIYGSVTAGVTVVGATCKGIKIQN